jgi:hypothetical protein
MSKKEDTQLTVRQQVWLAAWTAAVQSPSKYSPKAEATLCLEAFDEQFGENKVIKMRDLVVASSVEKPDFIVEQPSSPEDNIDSDK